MIMDKLMGGILNGYAGKIRQVGLHHVSVWRRALPFLPRCLPTCLPFFVPLCRYVDSTSAGGEVGRCGGKGNLQTIGWGRFVYSSVCVCVFVRVFMMWYIHIIRHNSISHVRIIYIYIYISLISIQNIQKSSIYWTNTASQYSFASKVFQKQRSEDQIK